MRVDGDVGEDGKQREYTTDSLASLRSPGELAITLGKTAESAKGELLVLIDSVEVETVMEE